MITWKEVAEKLTDEFMAWGCRFSRKQLPEIAMGYDCTPLFYWNWQDGEVEQSEKGFLRVLGYAWKKHFEEETGLMPQQHMLLQATHATANEQVATQQVAA